MMWRMAALFVLALMAASCSGDATGLDFGERRAILRDLERNEKKWEALALQNYRYDFRRVCECTATATTPVRIEVRDGSVFRVRKLSDGTDLPLGSGFWPTVEELFDEIRLALDGGATDIEVRYEPVYGYPLEVNMAWGLETAEGIVLLAGELTPVMP